MNDKSQQNSKLNLICPCCGYHRHLSAIECPGCGARQVGEPLAQPDFTVHRLGPAAASLVCALLIILAFLSIWIFGNDMKVGRVFLVQLLGESTEFTKNLLKLDPNLLQYRIFSYDAYRLAFILSAVFIPLSLAGLWLGRRAVRLVKKDSGRFGGLILAKVSIVLSACLLVIFSAVTITAIPGVIERGRARRLAATRAMMYELHREALQKYHREYGSYPQELLDLTRVNAESAPQSDYWERNFIYLPVGVIASKGSAFIFSNYKLVSAGPDGKFGTEDDITMIDGVIVEGQSDSDLPTTLVAPEEDRK
jgi:hypothetical protein